MMRMGICSGEDVAALGIIPLSLGNPQLSRARGGLHDPFCLSKVTVTIYHISYYLFFVFQHLLL